MTRRLAVAALLTAAGLAAAGATVQAQSVLRRPPNMSGTWVGATGTVYFNFVHRFQVTSGDVDKVLNHPTFLLGTGLARRALVGIRYGSNSQLVAAEPNELEYFTRYTPLEQPEGWPLALSVEAAYNRTARSMDAALTLARTVRERFRLLVTARGFTDVRRSGGGGWAWALGGTLRLSDHVALAGDYAELVDEDAVGGRPAWSAGVQLSIPYTPHTFSLHAANVTTTTLQGASLGGSKTRYGFEFTVPITLSRYFGSREVETAADAAEARVPGVQADAVVRMTNQLSFTPDTVRIRVGATVLWRNDSDLLHTVTAAPERAVDPSNVRLPEGASAFDSGQIEPGGQFERTFEVAGEYQYICVPHEMAGMIGWVIVGPG